MDVEPQVSSTYLEALMGDHQITLVFELNKYKEFTIGDYINYGGIPYTLGKLPQVKKLSTKLYQYNAVFQHPKYEMLKVIYMLFDNTSTPLQGEFALTGTPEDFIDLLIANMNRISSGWSKGEVIEGDYKTLSFSNEDCLAVLSKIASEYDTEFHVMNKTVHLEKITTQRELTLEYGSTAYDIERTSINREDVVTRLYPFGSDKNITSTYREGSPRLLIPEPDTYIDSLNVFAYGIIEKAKTFDDIYPRLSLLGSGVVSSVGNTLSFSDTSIDFDVNEFLLPGVPAKVHFLTGDCAGYSFEIASYKHVAKIFRLISNSQDEDFVLPTEELRPREGDKYVLLDIEMPEEYRNAAEEELLTKAKEYLADNDTAKVDYRVRFSEIYAKQHLPTLQCADTVKVFDDDLRVNEHIRIVKLQRSIRNEYQIQIDLSNTVTRTVLQRIEGDIGSIKDELIQSDQINKQRGIASYQRARDLKEMVFDTDGYFDPENIRPLSIETSMLSVGAKSQQFQLSCLLQPNYNGNPQSLFWSAGMLVHFSLEDNDIPEWIVASGNTTITGENENKALYIYARCSKTTNTGDIYLSDTAIKFDANTSYWFFLIGILHAPLSGVRGISLTYGQTTINGKLIRTGVISSGDGSTYFDLDRGVIGGRISFVSTGGSSKDLGEWAKEQEDLLDETAAKRSLRIAKWTTPGYDTYRENVPYQATLGLRIFHDDEDVTDTINIARFVWMRISENEAGDSIWNAFHAHAGASVDLTNDDLVGDTSFICQFYSEDGTQLLSQETF